MVGLPRLHGELGAKRVEVTARQERPIRKWMSEFENVGSNNTSVSLDMDETFDANLSEPALLQGRAAGVGQPFTKGRDKMSEVRDQ